MKCCSRGVLLIIAARRTRGIMSRFRFTSELPDDQLFQDVLTLNLLSVPQLDQFIGVLLNFLADKCVPVLVHGGVR